MGVTASLKINKFDLVEQVLTEMAHTSCVVGVEATVADAKAQVEDQIGSGKKYPGLPKQSSAPLEAPVNQMEELLDSIHENFEPDIIGIGASADVDSPHGLFLELGTSKMEPRPFLGPAAVVGEAAAVEYVESIPATLKRIL